MTSQKWLVAQLDYHLSSYFNIPRTEKYGKAMCYLKIAGTCLGLQSSGGRGRRTQERARSHLCQMQTTTMIILMMMKMMILITIMINLAKRASPLSPIVRAILAIPKYSKSGLHTFGCNKHKVFYVSTLNKNF